MKKQLLAVCLVASFSACAKEKVCREYEFAELNTFSTAELTRLADEYGGIVKGIATITPITAAELREDMDDTKNCSGEQARIGRILEARQKKK